MNVVFLNTLEKQAGEERVISAQVSIGEVQGVWQVVWREPSEQGKPAQENWYTGVSWDELLTAFRQGLKEKLYQGFRPLIKGDYEGVQGLSGKTKLTQMLNYFSEMNPNEEMYENLRKWRKEQASREGKAPFILATNRMLRILSVFLPHSTEELLQIPGFGEQKTNMYGKEILKLTGEMPRETSFPLEWVVQAIDHNKFEAWVHAQKEEKIRMELDKETNKRNLLELVAGGASLDRLQAALSMQRRDLLLWIEDLEREGYDMEPLVKAELAAVSEEHLLKAWTAFETEGDRYLKPILQLIFNADELKDKELDYAYEWLRLLRLKFRKEKESIAS
ncbi:HRDC domain-containing protein [Paenibacillus eucommiae]|uniref:HRDC domain-containing protein n=1 Tax=Paenibacillus eucommiae TaxID=1355755 RepID=A0ABS4J2J7_9BACL|nr:HRDC domain-containing protein [Paenibacillus eucommiae]MBP1993481.1 hypothetical protein [Paenibacillus eucommiae]